ncbi:MAG TPA: AAA family ATPase [Chloroflexota bacterium]|nr:AAA family ATPase [Chloroflexota bacterium]
MSFPTDHDPFMTEEIAVGPDVEGRVRTFLFADVRGYTQFTVEYGDAAAARLIERFVDIVRNVVARRRGTVLEVRGDEILAFFESSRQALLAAAEIQGRLAETGQDNPAQRIKVGIGLDAGEAIPVEGGYRGAALNLASRLCSLAGAGEVLASETVAHLARKVDGLTYEERGRTQLKGFADPVMVMQVLPELEEQTADPGSPADADEPVQAPLPIGRFLGALPDGSLVAREDEMRRLLRIVDDVVAGKGRTVFLSGEPGAGKTRLAQEISLNVRNRNFFIAAGRCYEQESAVPYYPFLDAMAAAYAQLPSPIRRDAGRRWPYLGVLLPDEIDVPSGAGDRDEQRVLRTATSFLEAIAHLRPVALLIDDVHWADAASLKLLQHLARHTRNLPVLILGTYRDTELGSQNLLESALRDLNREGLMERLAVRRLPPEGTVALAADAIGRESLSPEFTELLHERTEGNPYFIQQVVRMLMERGDIYRQDGEWTRRAIEEIEVPESIRSVVDQRIGGLSTPAQEILHEASVLGQSFRFDDLEAMTERPEDELDGALEEADEAGLTTSNDGELYRFDHALTRQILYESLSPRRRRRLHLAAGTALEKAPERERSHRVPELAWHFLHADDAERAIRYAIEAGDQAEAVFAHGDAERQYRTALELIVEEEQTGQLHAEVLLKLGRAIRRGGRYGEALLILERAADAFVALADREGEVDVLAEIGRAHAGRGTADEGIDRVRPLLRDLEQSGLETVPARCTAALYSALAALYFAGGQWLDLVAAADDAARLAAESGDDRLLAEAEKERGRALALVGREAEAETAVRTAAGLAEKLGYLSALQGAFNTLGYLQRRAGELQSAIASYRRALDAAERLGDPSIIAFARSVLGRALVESGEWEEAETQFRAGLAAAESGGVSWYATYPTGGLGVLDLLRGERERGMRLLHEALELAQRNEDVQGQLFHHYLAQQEVLDGRPEDAIARLQGIGERTRSAGREIHHWALAWAHLEAGNLQEAAELAGEAGEHVLYEGRIEMPDMRRISAMIAVRQGHEHAAAGHLEEGLDLARSIGMPYQEALLLLEYGRLQRGFGNREAAQEALSNAAAIFQRLNARPYIERCNAELQTVTR